jgi:hypothetical protein
VAVVSGLAPSPIADPAPSRRFNIGDGLILIASQALSLERLRGMGWLKQFLTDLA